MKFPHFFSEPDEPSKELEIVPEKSPEQVFEENLHETVNSRVRLFEGGRVGGEVTARDNVRISEIDRTIADMLDQLHWSPEQFVGKCREWGISRDSMRYFLIGLNFEPPDVEKLLGPEEPEKK
jgi:hypothetical protein